MITMPSRRGVLAGLAIGLAGLRSTATRAAELPQPAGKPLLAIEGLIDRHNAGTRAIFDRDMLERLPSATIRTHTPWNEGLVTFQGVRMDVLMQAVGAHGQTVEAQALNDYVTEIPLSDFAAFGPILATKRNGADMPVADKGPLFIVYPYDSDPALAQEAYYNRSAWQVARLIVR